MRRRHIFPPLSPRGPVLARGRSHATEPRALPLYQTILKFFVIFLSGFFYCLAGDYLEEKDCFWAVHFSARLVPEIVNEKNESNHSFFLEKSDPSCKLNFCQ